jgi:hypothetical protein
VGNFDYREEDDTKSSCREGSLGEPSFSQSLENKETVLKMENKTADKNIHHQQQQQQHLSRQIQHAEGGSKQ